MRKPTTLIALGVCWAVLAGCEQEGPAGEAAEGLPGSVAPRTEPDLQIGRSDSVEPVEPAEPGSVIAPPPGGSVTPTEPSEPGEPGL